MEIFNRQEEPDEIDSPEENQEEESGLNSPMEEASVRVPSIPDPKQ